MSSQRERTIVGLNFHHLLSATDYNYQEIGGVVLMCGAGSLVHVGSGGADLANQHHRERFEQRLQCTQQDSKPLSKPLIMDRLLVEEFPKVV